MVLFTTARSSWRCSSSKLRGEIDQSDYQQANTEFDTEISAIEEQLRSTPADRVSPDALVRFAKAALLDVTGAWQLADA